MGCCTWELSCISVDKAHTFAAEVNSLPSVCSGVWAKRRYFLDSPYHNALMHTFVRCFRVLPLLH